MRSTDIPFEITYRCSLLEKKAARITQLLLILTILFTIVVAPKIERSFQVISSKYKLHQIQSTLKEEIKVFQTALDGTATQQKQASELTILSKDGRLVYSTTRYYNGENHPRIKTTLTPDDYGDISVEVDTESDDIALFNLFDSLARQELSSPLRRNLRRVSKVIDSRPYSFSVPDIRLASTRVPYGWIPYIFLCLTLYARELIGEFIEDMNIFVSKCLKYDSEDNKSFFRREFIPLTLPKIERWIQIPFTLAFSTFIILIAYMLVFISNNVFIDFYESSPPFRVGFYGAWRISLQAFSTIMD